MATLLWTAFSALALWGLAILLMERFRIVGKRLGHDVMGFWERMGAIGIGPDFGIGARMRDDIRVWRLLLKHQAASELEALRLLIWLVIAPALALFVTSWLVAADVRTDLAGSVARIGSLFGATFWLHELVQAMLRRDRGWATGSGAALVCVAVAAYVVW